ncbi:putative glutamine amidotransferase [Mycobacterium frederiksbergense]|uniref:Glutamine amidotransferase n=1 Tax=Mycolicibacterium frederiksbergense TaxID=117567 RepID=A0ABT6L6M1_9MYCO|nr:gamma-glutamyl-gamma-aminobutyrate hydrolase family protein [Mycolicibacterium frederiksbergense]MDH6198599.1 putative glutamine amidotransferase [Mycolicibacterium frederiksbergense]
MHPIPCEEPRPLIAVPGRFTASASALRYRGEVLPRALIEAVFAAGGEPVMLHPAAPGGTVSPQEVAARLAFADGVLLPGGGDLSPQWTHAEWHETHYDVDVEQDAFDLAVARTAVAQGIPLLAICRGMQVLNVALGGTLTADMNDGAGAVDHFHRVHHITANPGSFLARRLGPEFEVSCYHHQCVSVIAPVLQPAAMSADGRVEALELSVDGPHGWLVALQWHPEDTAQTDSVQMRVFEDFVDAARANAPARGLRRAVLLGEEPA